ncbi:MAG: AmmeMemoRadiSam system protein B [Planctomycetes bacterium]|nr:AmmeMemoRadiSam system protein B [Planctomycetota bacterium]
MSTTPSETPPSAPLAEHLNKPQIRNFQPLGMQKEGKSYVMLRDPSMLTEQQIVVMPQILQVILLFQGRETLDEIAAKTQAPMHILRDLVTRLDEVGLIWGPRFEELERVAKAKITAHGHFPMSVSAGLGKDAQTCGEALDKWLGEMEDPEIEGTILGLVAPHLDYQRGWPGYAAAYKALNKDQKPDRVIILGTNHFGIGDGVVVSEFGFLTPFGKMNPDKAVLAFLEKSLGSKRIYADQIDHLGEHSIQLHIPWIQHLYGEVPLVAALIPNPMVPPVADDDERATTDQFVTAVRTALAELGGRNLVIASSDLSHVGPQFGDQGSIDDAAAAEIEHLDRDRLAAYCKRDVAEFQAAFKKDQNRTRWCSIGNMSAAQRILQPANVDLIDYQQVREPNGISLVSSAAIAFSS